MNEAKIGIEVVKNKKGDILWVGRYVPVRLHGPGEIFIKESIAYLVITSDVIYWRKIALIELIVERKNKINCDTTQQKDHTAITKIGESSFKEVKEAFLEYCKTTEQYKILSPGEEEILDTFAEWIESI